MGRLRALWLLGSSSALAALAACGVPPAGGDGSARVDGSGDGMNSGPDGDSMPRPDAMNAMIDGAMIADTGVIPGEDVAMSPVDGSTPPLDGVTSTMDVVVPADSAMPRPDASAPIDTAVLLDAAPRADVVSTPDAASDTGARADVVVSCTASCGLGAVCVAGSCRCLSGFTASGSGCVRDAAPSNLEMRTQADVCARWRAGKVVTAARPFNAGSGAMCDPGTMTEEAVFDAANRWNMYRWMVGLSAVGVDRSNSADMQQCSLMLRYAFRHDPPPTTTCYTPGGAMAAGRSMICSVGNAAQCMDLYTMESYATDNRLSHRKIVVGTNRDNVNFGASAGGSCALYGYGAAPAMPPRFVAIPNPGFTPIEMARSTWSLHQVTDSAPLPVGNTQVFDETAMRAVTVRQNLRYAGINGWDLGEPVVAGHTYRVTLTDGATTITYRTTPVQCM